MWTRDPQQACASGRVEGAGRRWGKCMGRRIQGWMGVGERVERLCGGAMCSQIACFDGRAWWICGTTLLYACACLVLHTFSISASVVTLSSPMCASQHAHILPHTHASRTAICALLLSWVLHQHTCSSFHDSCACAPLACRYCSEACQRQAWRTGHRAACLAWQPEYDMSQPEFHFS